MSYRLIHLVLALCIVASLSSCASLSPQQPASGHWLQATGSAFAPVARPRGRVLKDATALAEEEARAKIRAKLQTIEIKPGVSIMQTMQDNPYVWSRIMGLMKATHASNQVVHDDGRVEVILRVNLDQIRDIAIYGEEAETIEQYESNKPARS